MTIQNTTNDDWPTIKTALGTKKPAPKCMHCDSPIMDLAAAEQYPVPEDISDFGMHDACAAIVRTKNDNIAAVLEPELDD